MGKKRRRPDSEENIRTKIRKLEKKLKKRSRRIDSSSSDSIPNRDDPVQEVGRAHTISPLFLEESAPELNHTPAVAWTSSETAPSAGPDGGQPQEQTNNGTPGEEPQPILDEEVLQLLGDAPEPEIILGKPVHKDIVGRWHEIIKKGLKKEAKEKIFNEYPVPENCNLLVPPQLNPEVKAALSDSLLKRDTAIINRQRHLSVSIAALTSVIDKIISKDITEFKDFLKTTSDVCRILCDMYRYETDTRKKFIITSINTELKEALSNCKSDKYLFGEELAERLKAAKTVQRSGQSLKQKQNFPSSSNTPFLYKNRENYHAPHQWRSGAGPSHQGQRQTARHPQSRAPPRPPPRASTAGARRPAPQPPAPQRATTRAQTRKPARL